MLRSPAADGTGRSGYIKYDMTKTISITKHCTEIIYLFITYIKLVEYERFAGNVIQIFDK